MMQDTSPKGAPHAALRNRSPDGGYVTLGTLILAALSAIFLVTMSGCHSTPASSAFAATTADKATEARLRPPATMTPLQPFDEGFVVAAETP